MHVLNLFGHLLRTEKSNTEIAKQCPKDKLYVRNSGIQRDLKTDKIRRKTTT